MTRFLSKIWDIFVITSFLIAQGSSALARGKVSPDSPNLTQPTLIAPVDEAHTKNSTPTFIWQADPDPAAVTYQFQVDDNNDLSSPFLDLEQAETTFTPGIALTDGAYFWRVQSGDGMGNWSGWSAIWSLTIDTQAPATPVLSSPADGLLTNINTPAFNWDVISDASQYRLQISVTSNFTSTIIDQAQAGASYTVSSPLADGVYYWRVNAIDLAGNVGDWSAIWSLTIDTQAPAMPTLIAPADNAAIADTTPDFSWGAISDAVSYRLQIGAGGNFSPPLLNQIVLAPSFTLGNPLGEGLYSWRVRATDAAGNTSVYSSVRSFTIDTTPPAVPILTAPADGLISMDNTPDFTWAASSGAVQYQFQVDDSSNFSSLELNQLVQNTGFTPGNSLGDGAYFWRVRAIDAAGNLSGWSVLRSLMIDTLPPEAPVLVTPANGTITNDNTPDFTWSVSPGTSQYLIQVNQTPDFSAPLLAELASGALFTPANLLPDGVYYWRVKAIDAAGNSSAWSATGSLFVDTTSPGSPTLASPPDGAITKDNTPTFSWSAVVGAAQYQIQADDDASFDSLRYTELTTSTSATPASALSDATLFWRVRAQDSAGNWGAWSNMRSITIDTIAPTAPALVAPSSGTITADNTPAFSWSGSPGAVEYRLLVATASDFSNLKIDQTISGLNFNASSALADGQYFWRVRAFDAAGNQSSWSEVRNFVIDTTPSSVPTLIGPVNGAITADNTPAFNWGASTSVTQYFIQVDDASNFADPLIDQSTSATSFTVTSALSDGTYFWHVQAGDAVGNKSAWSSTWSLVIDTTPPGAPSLVSPADGQITNDNTPTFTWDMPEGAIQFEIQVDDNDAFSPPIFYQTVSGGTFTYFGAIADGVYFWRVRALDAAGNQSGWSSIRTLVIDTTSPGTPVLLYPLHNDKTVDRMPAFHWVEVTNATQYRIQVDVAGNFSNPWIDQIVSHAAYTATLQLDKGLYAWRVKAGDAAGNWSAWSDPWVLEILDLAPLPFFDGFESGALGVGWSVSTIYDGHAQVAGNLLPGAVFSGSFSLFLDDKKPDTTASTAAAILTVDLTGMKVATLSFYWRDFGDEIDGDDGVYISDDYGATWYEILSFDGNQVQYKREEFDLIALAAQFGLKLNGHFQIKFQFYGNNGILDGLQQDGYGIDNVQVIGLGHAVYLPLIQR